ncbi:uncharacterized protein PHACADRAFT_207661 [Phanerochaete carnosa HHB-10118-sp]|uniref:AB hydrolase-1 domain-containing protein n=1 Tax=Phanerochaete carnosa (strain HHB-10118-sp) TaxID=650164 RepID=K5X0Z6_PHACS|nr:uncharacterized protein PHACADRAFT_207661 [Phanerochaete carnosa HHB-10118-sp]EKM56417.1 hypothetical protein PHACADRAFT_207661 [Phanerochaete carnosa HHB-10118-sp]
MEVVKFVWQKNGRWTPARDGINIRPPQALTRTTAAIFVSASKPTVLFCHGFPSTSHDWRHIVPRLKDKGYGVLVLDMLGYGGTDKPTDPAAYVPSLISKDIADILDAEKLEKVIAIGHDWGCKAISRLTNYYPERVLAYVFLGFSPSCKCCPRWTSNEPDANEVIQAHIDSFVSVMFPHHPDIWKERLAPTGALKQSLFEDFAAPRPLYLSEEDAKHFVETFRRGGFAAPTCWFKIATSKLSAEDDLQIPSERKLPPVRAPIYYAAAKDDYVYPPKTGFASFTQEVFRGHSVTMKEYHADHWLILSHGEEIARDLEEWIEGTVAAKVGL